MSIKTTKRAEDWHACIDGQPGKWGAGKTRYEAIGSLVDAWPGEFDGSAQTDRIAALETELAAAKRDAARYLHIRCESLIHWEEGQNQNLISWPKIHAADPIDGGNYRDRFDAAIDAAMGAK
jgi:hypothetical protein